MNSLILRELVSLSSVVVLFWLAMGLALRGIALSIPNLLYVGLAGFIGYTVCRIILITTLLVFGKGIGVKYWMFGVLALLSAFLFYCYVLRGASV
jgi:hypothetical protein